MIASIPYSPYETPVFGLILIVTLVWAFAVILGFARPRRYVGLLVLQFACSAQIGIIAVFASVSAMGEFLEEKFDLDSILHGPIRNSEQGSGPIFNLTELFAELSFAYDISKAGMWISCATFLASVLLMLTKRSKEGAEQTVPPNGP